MNASKQKIFEFKKKMVLGSLKSTKILIDILLIKLNQFEKTRSLFFLLENLIIKFLFGNNQLNVLVTFTHSHVLLTRELN